MTTKGDKKQTRSRPRRDKGDGSIYFREKEQRHVGSFWDKEGKRHYVAEHKGEGYTAFKARFEKIKAAAQAGKLLEKSTATVREYLMEWLEEKKLKLKVGTYPTWKSDLTVNVYPHIGSLRMQKIKRDHVQKWILLLQEQGLAPSSIKLFFTIVKSAFTTAVRRKIITENPCEDVVLPRAEDEEMLFLDEKQTGTFLRTLREMDYMHEALFTLAVTIGLRKGELLALRWSDIDFERKTIHVRRSVRYLTGVGNVEQEPKTKGSRRTLLINDVTLEVLRKQRIKVLQQRFSPEWTGDLVFPGKNGKHMAGRTPNYRLSYVLKKAGLPEIRFHDLRHTAATMMLRAGVSLRTVQKFLGHADIKTTMRYVHLLPSMEEDDVQRLNILLSKVV